MDPLTHSTKYYLLASVEVIKSNIQLAIIPVAAVILTYTPTLMEVTDKNVNIISLFSLAGFIALLLSFPLVYGRFIDILAKRNLRPWLQIIKNNLLDYLIVSLIVNLPVIFISKIGSLLEIKINYLEILASIVCDSFSLYIIPLVFINHERLSSIPLGAKCLLGNLKFNIPLISIIFFSTILHFLIMYQFVYFTTIYALNINRFAISFILSILLVVLDLIIFIAAALILKDKLLIDS